MNLTRRAVAVVGVSAVFAVGPLAVAPSNAASPAAMDTTAAVAMPAKKQPPGSLTWKKAKQSLKVRVSGEALARGKVIDLSRSGKLQLAPGVYRVEGIPNGNKPVAVLSESAFAVESGKPTRLVYRVAMNQGTVNVTFGGSGAGNKAAVLTLTDAKSGKAYAVTSREPRVRLPAGIYDAAATSLPLGDGRVALGVPSATAIAVTAGSILPIAVDYTSITAGVTTLIDKPLAAVGPIEYLNSVTTPSNGLKVGDPVVMQVSQEYPYGFYGLVAFIDGDKAVVERSKPLDVFDSISVDGDASLIEVVRAAQLRSRALGGSHGQRMSSTKENDAAAQAKPAEMTRGCSSSDIVRLSSELNLSLGQRTFKVSRDRGIEEFAITVVLSDQMYLSAFREVALECSVTFPLVPSVPIASTGLFFSVNFAVKAGMEVTLNGGHRQDPALSPRFAIHAGARYKDGQASGIFDPSIRLGGLNNPLAGETVIVDLYAGGALEARISVGPNNDIASVAAVLEGKLEPHIKTEDAFGPERCWAGVLETDVSLRFEAKALWDKFKAERQLLALSDYFDTDTEFPVRILDGTVSSTCELN